jgi:hypothetical protein
VRPGTHGRAAPGSAGRLAGLCSAGLVLFAVAGVRAEVGDSTQPPPAQAGAVVPAPGPVPPAGAAAATPPAGPLAPGAPPAPGASPVGPTLTGRLGEGQATIVGGNVASARERALIEAFKRAVDTAIDGLGLGPDVRANQPKLVVQVLGRARAFVRRYRTLDEGERVPGSYSVRIDAEIDEGALRRALERPVGGGVTGAPSTTPGLASPPGVPTYLLVGSGGAEAAAAVSKALTAGGGRVQLGTASDADAPARAIEAAARAKVGAVAFVSATALSEGRVRGPGLESVSCTVGLRIVQAGTGLPQSDETETVRTFSEHEEIARSDCYGRAAAAVVARAVPQIADPSRASGLRTVTIDADVVEPGAVLAVLKQLRGTGPVSGVDLRSVVLGRVELQVRSRLPGEALTALLARDASVLDWSAPEVTGDLVRARVRLRSNEAERVPPLESAGEAGAGPPSSSSPGLPSAPNPSPPPTGRPGTSPGP